MAKKLGLQNIAKYENRETGDICYFGKQGVEYFERSKNFKKFKFIGMISQEEQEEENAEKLTAAEKRMNEVEEKGGKPDSSKSKAKTEKLSAEEIAVLTKSKKTKVKKPGEDDDDENLDPTNDLS